jgi:tripartite-type tricarboxylate transporter receptor subunit TctC
MVFKKLALPLVACALALVAQSSMGQAFPSQPVRVISAFSPGSGPDALFRIVAEQVSGQWKQPIIIDNKTGASGFIAASAVKAAAPTGHELFLADVGHMSINPSLFRNMPYSPKDDFVPVTTIFQTSFFITVSAASKIRSVKDLVASATANPQGVSYGSFAVGSIGHLGGAQLEAATGTQMLHVAFKEASQLYASIAAGDVTWGLGAPTGPAGALMKADKLRFLAVADSVRSPVLPDVPTIKESGGPDGVSGRTWVALFAPRGTPPQVVESINRSFVAVLRRPDIVEKFAASGLVAWASTPGELAEVMERDRVGYAALVKRVGIAPN